MKTTTINTPETIHTPGPWRADKWAGSDWTVCAPESHYSVCHLGDCNNAEANARLIAAAPDILAALTRAVDHLIMDAFSEKPRSRDVLDALRQARAAIAKAKGAK